MCSASISESNNVDENFEPAGKKDAQMKAKW